MQSAKKPKGECDSPTEGKKFEKILGGVPEARSQDVFNEQLDPAKRKRAPGAAGF